MKNISLKLFIKYLLILSVFMGNIYAEDSYIIMLKKKSSVKSSNSYSETAREQALRLIKNSSSRKYSIPTKSIESKLGYIFDPLIKGFSAILTKEEKEKLEKNPEVDYISKNQKIFFNPIIYPKNKLNKSKNQKTLSIHYTNNFIRPWGLDRINQVVLPLDNNYTYINTGQNVHVYVVDTGIRATHEEFEGRMGNGYDIYDDDDDPTDVRGHGTHVAGIIGGTYSGVAKNVILHDLKIFGQGSTNAGHAIAALTWIKQNYISPAIVNISFRCNFYQPLNDAVNSLIASGITVIVAAGNESTDACNVSPASVSAAITVAASDRYDDIYTSTNYGRCIDIYAPGVDIKSADYHSDHSYISMEGTSMAAPHVAGVAALYLETHPNATPEEVSNYIIGNSTNDIIHHNKIGTPNKLLLTLEHTPSVAGSFFKLVINGDTSETTLKAYHPHDGIIYEISQQPNHGVISGIAPNLSYTPNSGYFGNDSFKYKVKDGNHTTEATVNITNIDTTKCLSKSELTLLIRENIDVTNVNTSCIEDMSRLFAENESFNQNISQWNTSNVTNMAYMFSGAKNFNQPIGRWDTRKVIKMNSMFENAKAFNKRIGNWHTDNVTNMRYMFLNAYNFNQDISQWNTINVEFMSYMFRNAYSFNQDISKWNIENLSDATKIFSTDVVSTENYSNLLKSWSTQNVKQNVKLGAHLTKYNCSSKEARDRLINQYHWHIDDNGFDGSSCENMKPIAPSHLHATPQQTTATLNWQDNADNETGYKIYQGSSTTSMATLDVNTTSYPLTGLNADTNYTYSVRAYNDAGESNATSVTFETLGEIMVTKSMITSPSNGSKVIPGSTITIRWQNHGATKKVFHSLAYINNEWKKIKSDPNIQGTSTTIAIPLGFSLVFVKIESYDANNQFLGSSYVFLSPKRT